MENLTRSPVHDNRVISVSLAVPVVERRDEATVIGDDRRHRGDLILQGCAPYQGPVGSP
jgi:hypothetical protein